MIPEILITGAVRSGIFALLALGFSLIFGVARIINLSHTAYYMLAAYLVYLFASMFELNLLLSVTLSIVFTVLIGMAVYRLCIHPVREHELTVLIITVAIAVIFQQVVLMVFGGQNLGVPGLVVGYVGVLGVKILTKHILVLGLVSAVLVALWAFLTKTRMGIAIQSTAQDSEVASLMGINERNIYLITMGIAVALAAIAGALIAPVKTLHPYMWMDPLVVVLAVVVLGGLGSLKGSVIAAFILGYGQTIFTLVFPSYAFLKVAIAMAILLTVLLIRPEGLFGVTFEVER